VAADARSFGALESGAALASGSAVAKPEGVFPHYAEEEGA